MRAQSKLISVAKNMEFLRKRTILSASKPLLVKSGHSGNNIQSSTTSAVCLSRTCFSSAAYQRVERLSGYEGKRRGQEYHDHHDKNVENMNGVTKMAENLGDMAKETMDKAWDSAKNTTQNVQDTIIAAADENVVDTTEYRTMEELRNSAEANGHI